MAWEALFLVWVVAFGFALVKFYEAVTAIQSHRNGTDHTAHGDD